MNFWYRFDLKQPLDETTVTTLMKMAGVRVVRGKRIYAGINTAWMVAKVLPNVTPTVLPDFGQPLVDVPMLPEMRPHVEGFGDYPNYLLPWQKEILLKFGHLAGAHLWWGCGCLSGATKLVINRNGCARVVELGTLVKKLQGQVTRNPRNKREQFWDLTIPTFTQSVDAEGFVRLNRIERVFENGVKEVFEVTTKEGRCIRATGEHRFRQPDGTFVELRALHVGDTVMCVEWPKAHAKSLKRKSQYKLVHHMDNHPFAVCLETARKDRPGFKRTTTVPEHRLVIEAAHNDVSFEELVGRIVLGRIDGLKFFDPKEWHVHHKDHDVRNNVLSNLELMSNQEHTRHHGKESAWKHVAGRVAPDTIVSIESKGAEPVYDLSMSDPLNNYVANEFSVHNSGKALGSVLWSILHPGLIVFVTRNSACRTIERDTRRFTTIEPLILETTTAKAIPPGTRMVITGWSTLHAHVDVLVAAKPTTVVFDEIHRASSHKRWTATPKQDADGNVIMRDNGQLRMDYKAKKNMAASAMRLSQVAMRRLGATATPISDRLRDLWAQLDLVEPEMWGGFYDWARRYCLPPSAPIWMGDFTHKRIDQVKIGDVVIGWSDDVAPVNLRRNPNAKFRRARFVKTTVTAVHTYPCAPLVKVTMESGRTLQCTPDHRWLRGERFTDALGVYAYIPVKVGRRLSFVVDPNQPDMTTEQQRAAAWLAGMYDGEGHGPFIAQSSLHNPETFKELHRTLTLIGVPHCMRIDTEATAGGAYISGGRDGLFDFFNKTRPLRFAKVGADEILKSNVRRHKDRIVAIEEIEPGPVHTLTTATGNYVAYGYASKNCNAAESVWGGINTAGRASDPYLQELSARMSFVVHQVPYSVTHKGLPPKRRQVVYIPSDQLRNIEGKEERQAFEAAAKAHSASLMAHARLAAAASRKRPAVVDTIADAIGEKQKLVVVTGLQNEAQKLHDAIAAKLNGKRKGNPISTWVGTGSTDIRTRNEIQDAFMAHPGPCVLVGTMEAWGESLNLQDCDIAFAAMLPFTVRAVGQFEGRFARQGQKRPVLIQYLIAEGTYDEHVAQILLEKLPAVEKIVGDAELANFGEQLSGLEHPEKVEAELLSKLFAGEAELEEDNR